MNTLLAAVVVYDGVVDSTDRSTGACRELPPPVPVPLMSSTHSPPRTRNPYTAPCLTKEQKVAAVVMTVQPSASVKAAKNDEDINDPSFEFVRSPLMISLLNQLTL